MHQQTTQVTGSIGAINNIQKPPKLFLPFIALHVLFEFITLLGENVFIEEVGNASALLGILAAAITYAHVRNVCDVQSVAAVQRHPGFIRVGVALLALVAFALHMSAISAMTAYVDRVRAADDPDCREHECFTPANANETEAGLNGLEFKVYHCYEESPSNVESQGLKWGTATWERFVDRGGFTFANELEEEEEEENDDWLTEWTGFHSRGDCQELGELFHKMVVESTSAVYATLKTLSWIASVMELHYVVFGIVATARSTSFSKVYIFPPSENEAPAEPGHPAVADVEAAAQPVAGTGRAPRRLPALTAVAPHQVVINDEQRFTFINSMLREGRMTSEQHEAARRDIVVAAAEAEAEAEVDTMGAAAAIGVEEASVAPAWSPSAWRRKKKQRRSRANKKKRSRTTSQP